MTKTGIYFRNGWIELSNTDFDISNLRNLICWKKMYHSGKFVLNMGAISHVLILFRNETWDNCI